MLPALSLMLAVATAAPAPTTFAVPTDHGPQDVVVMERVFAPGGETGWHTHAGVEICQVVSGEVEIRTPAGTTRYAAGQTGVIPRGVAHDAVNVGEVPLVLAVTLVVDHGTPLRTMVTAP